MIRSLLSRKQILTWSSRDLADLLDFCQYLLSQPNYKSKSYYFKKSDSLPTNPIRLRSFLHDNHSYNHQSTINLYQAIQGYFKNITISQFYNLITYLQCCKPPLDLDSVYKLSKSYINKPNDLKSIDISNARSKILKIIL